MPALQLPCGSFIEFLNESHLITWTNTFGDCKKGCWTKDCENVDLKISQNSKVKIRLFNVK